MGSTWSQNLEFGQIFEINKDLEFGVIFGINIGYICKIIQNLGKHQRSGLDLHQQVKHVVALQMYEMNLFLKPKTCIFEKQISQDY